MPNLGPTELIIILVIIIAVFGAGKLAGLGGALGKGVSDFRQAVKDVNENSEAKNATSAAVKAAVEEKVTEETEA